MSIISKYPRTPHLFYSERINPNDIVKNSDSIFYDKQVIVTEKLDGENTSLYNNYIHARSIDSNNKYDSLNYAKNKWNSVKYLIPENMCVVVENIYYNDNISHTIKYNSNNKLYIISIRVEDTVLSYDDIINWSSILNIPVAPLLYRGIYDINKVKQCYSGVSRLDGTSLQEGYVVRNANSFKVKEFQKNVNKFVSEKFEISETHWRL